MYIKFFALGFNWGINPQIKASDLSPVKASGSEFIVYWDSYGVIILPWPKNWNNHSALKYRNSAYYMAMESSVGRRKA